MTSFTVGDLVVIDQSTDRGPPVQHAVILWKGPDCGTVLNDQSLSQEHLFLQPGEVALVLGTRSNATGFQLQSAWLQVGDREGWTWSAFLALAPPHIQRGISAMSRRACDLRPRGGDHA